MNLAEFEDQKAALACQACGHVGLETHRNSNNNGVRPECPQCGSHTPLAGIQWLSQNNVRPRRAATGYTLAVWKANGDHCSFCGKPRWLCERLGIGLTSQHVWPVVFGGDGGPLIPFCARCQEQSVAALRETRNVLAEVDRLDEVIKRIETKNPQLLA